MTIHADSHSQPEPNATASSQSVTDAVISDLQLRRGQGIVKYGLELLTFNGRDALVDAYQEALDLSVYIKQRLLERDAFSDTDLDPNLVAQVAQLSVRESRVLAWLVSRYLVVRRFLARLVG